MLALLLVSSAAAAVRTAAGTCEGFWIINSRYAPQETPCYAPEGLRYQRWEQGHAEEATLEEFLGSLSPDVPVCFFAHGNLADSCEALDEGRQACRALREAGPDAGRMTFVLVSWPSQRLLPLTSLDLGVKSKRSDATAYYLASVLTQIPPEQPVCLIGHSLGARTVLGSLELLSDGAVRGRPLPDGHGAGPQHIHAALLAASVDHDWLNRGQRYAAALRPVDAMMIMENRRDAALGLYPLRKPFSPAALGKVGLRDGDWRCIADEDGAKISEVDVSRLVGCRHHVSAYFREPAINELMAPLVYFSSENGTGSTIAARR